MVPCSVPFGSAWGCAFEPQVGVEAAGALRLESFRLQVESWTLKF